MKYAQFYKHSTGYVAGTIPPQFSTDNVKPIEAIGSNGVAIIDGRLNLSNARRIARETCAKRGFIGYSLHIGASFSDSREWASFVSI